jgi:hypothetical protein
LIFTICGVLWLGGVLAPARAQGEAESLRARKVQTYNDRIGSSEAEQWHLEDFRELLSKEPNSQAFIIAYNGREDNPGKSRRYAVRAKNYLVNSRGIPPQRIFAIEGGRRDEFMVELWLAPKGSKAPEPAPTVTEQDDPGDNLLYDSYSPGYDNFGNYHEGMEGRLGGFAAMLKKEPAAWGCVIAYAQNGDDNIGIEWDSPRIARETSQGVKNYLVTKHGFRPSGISAVDGGYSEGRTVELWIMRPGARFDKGPFVYPYRLKAGRGATLTLDKRDWLNDCCKACSRERARRNNNPRRTRKQ